MRSARAWIRPGHRYRGAGRAAGGSCVFALYLMLGGCGDPAASAPALTYEPLLTWIEAEPRELSLSERGQVVRLTVTAYDQRYHRIADPVVRWESTDSLVVIVTPEGDAIAVGDGSASVRAFADSIASNEIPVAVTTWTAVSVGDYHVCAIATGGTAYCWGLAEHAQTGWWSELPGPAPLPVSVPADFIALDASLRQFTCGLAYDHRAYCWGWDDIGQLGDGGMRGDWIFSEGTLVWGSQQYRLLAAGGYHTCGVASSDSTAYCWGANWDGQVGITTHDYTTAPFQVDGDHQFSRIVAGERHTCALTPSGQLYCWGANSFGQLGIGSVDGVPHPLPLLVDISVLVDLTAGADHTCGLAQDGAAYCWGLNDEGQLGNGSTTDSPTATGVIGDLRFGMLSAGYRHTCGVTKDGSATYCWGQNDQAQLGDGSTSGSPVPVRAAAGIALQSVSAGFRHSCGLTPAGGVYCWGDNRYGQLGDGTTLSSPVPRLVVGPAMIR